MVGALICADLGSSCELRAQQRPRSMRHNKRVDDRNVTQYDCWESTSKMSIQAQGKMRSERCRRSAGPNQPQAGQERSLHHPRRDWGSCHRGHDRGAGNENREARCRATRKGARRKTGGWRSVGWQGAAM
jgi:hypothetical protein